MKKIKLTLSILFLSAIIFAQNFAPINTTWHYKIWTWSWNENSYIKVVSDRDTIIAGKYVTILELYKNEVYIPEARTYIHESDDVVYFIENEEFKILYDFNLEVGDTLVSNIPINGEYYNISGNWPNESADEETRLIVDSISVLEVDDEILKTLHTRYITDPDSTNCISYESIHERIGSRSGLFGRGCYQILAGWPGFLRCYSDDIISYNPDAVDCESGLSDIEELEEDFIQVYPNPVRESIFIFGDKAGLITSFEIVNMSGAVVLKSEFIDKNINVEWLPSGVYWLRFFNENDVPFGVEKIIKYD